MSDKAIRDPGSYKLPFDPRLNYRQATSVNLFALEMEIVIKADRDAAELPDARLWDAPDELWVNIQDIGRIHLIAVFNLPEPAKSEMTYAGDYAIFWKP